MDAKEFIREHTAIDPTKPANSLKNFFFTIPLIIALLFGIRIDGNPLSKVSSSFGVGVRRAVFSTGEEITPQITEGTQAIYGKGTQTVNPLPQKRDNCEQRGDWLYCPDGNRN